MSERLSKPKSDDLNPSTDENKSPINLNDSSTTDHPCHQSSSPLEANQTPSSGAPPTESLVTSSPEENAPVITSITETVASGVIATNSTLAGDVITTTTSTGTSTRGIVPTTTDSDSPNNLKDTPTSTLTTTNTKTTTATTASTTPRASGIRTSKLQEPSTSRQRHRGKGNAFSKPSSSTMVVTLPFDNPGVRPRPSAAGGNGHALPRGIGENRDAPRNPLPLLASPSASTIHHGERLIGPVVASVPPPALRKADAQRNSERIASVNRQLRRMPVKRKLFEVDHEQVEKDVKKELDEVRESDAKRFKEKYEILPPEENSDAPIFYHSKEITSDRKRVAVMSPATTTTSSSSSSSSSDGALPSPSVASNTPASSSSVNAENGAQGSNNSSGTSTGVAGREIDSGVRSRGRPSSVGTPEEDRTIRATDESPLPPSTPTRRTSQRRSTTRRNPDITQESPSSTSSSSTLTSPSSSYSSFYSSPSTSSLSSSLNLSTSSRSSSSGVSSLESTPTHLSQSSQQTVTPAGTNTPMGSADTPTQGGGFPPLEGRITHIQETSTPTQRPSTAVNVRKRRSTQSPQPPPDSNRRRKPPRI